MHGHEERRLVPGAVALVDDVVAVLGIVLDEGLQSADLAVQVPARADVRLVEGPAVPVHLLPVVRHYGRAEEARR